MSSSNSIDFSLYVAILGQSAMMQLGKIMNPANGKLEKDLIQAKFTIDVLGILEEKTKGNLTNEESELLKSTLTNLRLNYVEEVKEEQEKKEKEKKEEPDKKPGKPQERVGAEKTTKNKEKTKEKKPVHEKVKESKQKEHKNSKKE